jgi:hypothetical protein
MSRAIPAPFEPELSLPTGTVIDDPDYDRLAREAASELGEPDDVDPLGMDRALVSSFDEDSIVVPIVRKGEYAFDGRLSGQVQEVVLANAVDASWWVRATILFVVHAAGRFSSSATAQIRAASTVIAAEAPDVSFVGAIEFSDTNSFSASSSLPFMTLKTVLPPFGPQLRLSLRFSQGASSTAALQMFTMSVYLVGRAH